MKWFLKVLTKNYANFSGRARRQEYWMFFLFQVLIFFFLAFLSNLFEEFGVLIESDIFIGVFSIYALATLIPWLAVNVRRLHDTGKGGGYLFINLIPLVGRIWYIVLMASHGDTGVNKYGPDPKAPNEDEIDAIGKLILDN